MVREFKFFRGYKERTLTEQWEDIFRNYPSTPGTGTINWTGTTYTPTWVVNPGLITYTPGYYGTITTTPGTYTIPYNGTITTGTSTGFSLTTSNTNGTTYTTANFGGTLTTGTATYTNNAFTTNIK